MSTPMGVLVLLTKHCQTVNKKNVPLLLAFLLLITLCSTGEDTDSLSYYTTSDEGGITLEVLEEDELEELIGISTEELQGNLFAARTPLNIERYCDVIGNQLDCEDPTLFVPQKANSCDSTVNNSGKVNELGLDYVLPDTTNLNIYSLRETYGTANDHKKSFRGGGGFYVTNPYVIFSDEAFTITYEPSHETTPTGLKLAVVDVLQTEDGSTQVELGANDNGKIVQSPYLYDDGTHGDSIANDGIYTRACIVIKDYEKLFNNKSEEYIDLSELLYVLNPLLKGSEEIFEVSENVLVSDGGFFVDIGYDYTQIQNNSLPLANNPWEFCRACERVFNLTDDVVNVLIMTPRDRTGGAGWMARMADHIRGTGFWTDVEGVFTEDSSPARKYDERNYVDGREHMELLMILFLAGPQLDDLTHEFSHSILGQTADSLPGLNEESWNWQDGMHLDSDVTARNSLQAGFKLKVDSALEDLAKTGGTITYKDVKIFNDEYPDGTSTKLIYQDGKFKLIPLENKPWSDIFLYSAGVIDASEVNETYYKLVNSYLINCSEKTGYHQCFEDNEVKAEKVLSFGVEEMIDLYGEWSYAYGDLPNPYKVAYINLSDRPHSEAEIIFSTKFNKGHQQSSNTDWVDYKSTIDYTTKGLIKLDFNALDMVSNSQRYINLAKASGTSSQNKTIGVDDLESYKNLYIRAVDPYFDEDTGNELIPSTSEIQESISLFTSIINLVPELPQAYVQRAKAYIQLDNYSEALSDLNEALDRLSLIFPALNTVTAVVTLSDILMQRALVHEALGNEEEASADLAEVLKYDYLTTYSYINMFEYEVAKYEQKICNQDPENGFYEDISYEGCVFINIANDVTTKDGDSIDYIWIDEALDTTINMYFNLGRSLNDFATRAGSSEIAYDSLKRAIISLEKALEIDEDGVTWWYRFVLRELIYVWANLADMVRFPFLSEEDIDYARGRSEYYFDREQEVTNRCQELWGGTYNEQYCGA